MKEKAIYTTVSMLILSIAAFVLFGNQRGCQAIKRQFQAKDRCYTVTVYSGGKSVKEYSFKGIINNSKNSDGIYWFDNGELVEVSGDYIVDSKDCK